MLRKLFRYSPWGVLGFRQLACSICGSQAVCCQSAVVDRDSWIRRGAETSPPESTESKGNGALLGLKYFEGLVSAPGEYLLLPPCPFGVAVAGGRYCAGKVLGSVGLGKRSCGERQ
jgi:hypothetical protein